jgi:hypothetical protein
MLSTMLSTSTDLTPAPTPPIPPIPPTIPVPRSLPPPSLFECPAYCRGDCIFSPICFRKMGFAGLYQMCVVRPNYKKRNPPYSSIRTFRPNVTPLHYSNGVSISVVQCTMECLIHSMLLRIPSYSYFVSLLKASLYRHMMNITAYSSDTEGQILAIRNIRRGIEET